MPKQFTKNDPRINRNGRPRKEFCLTQGLRDYMFTRDPKSKKAIRDLLIEKMFELALQGDLAAMKLIISYTDGIPKPIEYDEMEREKLSDEAIEMRIKMALESSGE